MQINADFTRSVFTPAATQQWTPSPQTGVERIMLDRIGAEKAQASSIVRYAAGAGYPEHGHPGGEEILVLSGTFSEGGQHHHTGSYLRNPPHYRHQPFSADGCIIFVKLGHMAADETGALRINSNDPAHWSSHDGYQACVLFADAQETSCLLTLPALTPVPFSPHSNHELLVLGGALTLDDGLYEQNSWIRLATGDRQSIVSSPAGAKVYIKTIRRANRKVSQWMMSP